MELMLLQGDSTTLRVGYNCPCGCTPSVAFTRGADLVEEGCCCGNHFAVGPQAAASLSSKEGFHAELQTFDAPWGERLEAVWLVGPSVHGPSADQGHDHHAHRDAGAEEPSTVIDRVCGMTVELETARAKGLHSSYEGNDYFFCGKGCKLEFDDDPGRYHDPSYNPLM